MYRRVFYCLACVSLAGCVSNTLSSQEAQMAAVGASSPPSAPPAPALAGTRTLVANKTALAGSVIKLVSGGSLGPDCTEEGQVGARVITPPGHGSVRISQILDFTNYAPADPHYPCNQTKTPMTLVTYQSAFGYSGQDVAAVQLFFPDGRAPTMIFHVDVH